MSNSVLRHKEILALLLRYENRLLDAYGITLLPMIEIIGSFFDQGQREEPLLAWYMVYCIVRRINHCF